MTIKETEEQIWYVKKEFQEELAKALSLQRVSAPLFLKKGTGESDDLSGTEKKASFTVKATGETAEVVFSLAKWKRQALATYGFSEGEGLYTDMDAIRPDEEHLDSLHSVYVDQWDWEKVISQEKRSVGYLKRVVGSIFSAMKTMEKKISSRYGIKPILPAEIRFVHTEELLQRWPELTPKEREDKICKEHGAVFLRGIGCRLSDGAVHDVRAPDYDDYTTMDEGYQGLSGDILVWYPPLERAFEISSMGIRVDKEALLRQLRLEGAEDRLELEWHKRLLAGDFPLTVGGGIGQSRLCMFLLRKQHIGEVQASVWEEGLREELGEGGVFLL